MNQDYQVQSKSTMPVSKDLDAPPTPVEQRRSPLHMISAADIPKASGWIDGKTPIC